MEFFRETKIDWMGKARYFFLLSAVLLLVGGLSWLRKGSLRYGIDFKGGTLVYVRFAKPPAIDQIRNGLAEQGLHDAVIQQIGDVTRPGANEVVIGMEQRGSDVQALDAGKTAILTALRKVYAAQGGSRQDLNSAGSGPLGEFLARKDPFTLGASAGTRYADLARNITRYRDSERSGLLTSFDELKKVEGVTDGVLAALRDGYRSSLAALQKSTQRLAGLAPHEALVESFLLGGRVIRQIVLDPLLPEPLVPTKERRALVEAMCRYDRAGRSCWSAFLTQAIEGTLVRTRQGEAA